MSMRHTRLAEAVAKFVGSLVFPVKSSIPSKNFYHRDTEAQRKEGSLIPPMMLSHAYQECQSVPLTTRGGEAASWPGFAGQ